MMKKKKSTRVYRVSELIQTTIASLLQKDISDPRLRMITITGVDLSPDGTRAIVFFSLLDPNDDAIKLVKTAFEKASGFFRFNLSRSTELRHTPQLVFQYDVSSIVGERVSRLLKD